MTTHPHVEDAYVLSVTDLLAARVQRLPATLHLEPRQPKTVRATLAHSTGESGLT